MITEMLGQVAGLVAAPFFGLTSRLRRARTFHPSGDLARAEVEIVPEATSAHAELGALLAGPALVRLSSALAKNDVKWPDVLGCAIRFARDANLGAGDQDILFATILRPWTMPIAPFLTRTQDYFANDYFAVSPFSAPGFEEIYLRLRPRTLTSGAEGTSRRERLEEAVDRSHASFDLSCSPSPYGPFTDVATVKLVAMIDGDDPRLHFDPFRTGRGIRPKGFVHSIRSFVYAASQRARDATSPVTTPDSSKVAQDKAVAALWAPTEVR